MIAVMLAAGVLALMVLNTVFLMRTAQEKILTGEERIDISCYAQ